ncbi:unnamed protein product [Clonostachys rosea f. rosea IK726]|uniref:Uncharacterized protein n=1 Tax=Clonostachys rosea f. rosea IK726 TaxID=1349383 RepID=A0ACA9U5V7_BIOOC|nr:unnamed protein product [Clonostachys rosea f. rosea IK726]
MYRNDPQLIQSDPVLHPVPKTLVVYPRIPLEVLLGLLNVLANRHNDLVTPVAGPSDTEVISSTEWDDAGPWERKPVRFRAVLGEKIKVLLVSVVVVAGDIAVSPIRTRWFQVGEGIPDARSPPIFISSAFDLATLRATVSRFFISPTGIGDPLEIRARILRSLAVDTEPERIGALRSLTLLTALCAAVTYVVPKALVPNKHMTAPLSLRASRQMLSIYEDYDLENPNSSSLSIRLFLSSAIQNATGTHGEAFHILGEAGLIAMRMRLYDESSLDGVEPIEENLLRNPF